MTALWNSSAQAWTVSLHSVNATSVRLQVAHRRDPGTAVLDLAMTREGSTWSLVLRASDTGDADLYGFRVAGSSSESRRDSGFDTSKFLLDPDATHVWFPPGHDRESAKTSGVDTQGRAPMGVLRRIDSLPALPPGPRHAARDLVIYELHVRGATMSAPHVPAELRGTFAGLSHHVEYIASLGVTAVELLPVHQGDPQEGSYWGYMPLAWSALHQSLVAGDDPEAEFRQMVEAFHAEGIEVLLDVVYNHTTEEDAAGPVYHLRGIDDTSYYLVDEDGSYTDDAGCGNVVRAAHPAARALIMSSLRRFADLGVDGFRFDLASLLGRDIHGEVQRTSALIDEITTFAVTRGLRLISEPWDLRSYQLGDGFAGRTWAQWNGAFRDDIRSFVRGEEGMTHRLAQRLDASPDLFGRDAARSVNFVTAHDGFTLYDLVSYESKHNEANGHGNDDGSNDNRSWNCGVEGDPDDAGLDPDESDLIRLLRAQQMRNLLCLLLFSRGTPMLLAGDEFAQTQHGNNNAYNQDNETTWLDWQRAETFDDLTEFVRSAVDLRVHGGDGPILVYGTEGEADLSFSSHSLAWSWGDLYVMANAWWEPLNFVVQELGEWAIELNTGNEAVFVANGVWFVPARTTVVLRRVAP